MRQCDPAHTWIADTWIVWGQDLDEEARHGLCLVPHDRVSCLQVQHQVVGRRVAGATLNTMQGHAHPFHWISQKLLKVTSLKHLCKLICNGQQEWGPARVESTALSQGHMLPDCRDTGKGCCTVIARRV